MLLHQRANLADQPINNNCRKLKCVSRPLVMKQTFDRHMSIMFDQPSQSGLLTSGVFKIPGFVCKRFLSSPLPPPSFFFFFLFFFLALVPFLARPKPKIPFLPPGKGAEIRRPRPLYNFRTAHDTATKITRNSVLSIINIKAQLMCMMSILRHIKFVSRTEISSSYLKNPQQSLRSELQLGNN